jgi:transposase
MRKSFNPELKARLIKALWQGEKTIAQLSSDFSVHPNQIRRWDKTAKENLSSLFMDKRGKRADDKDKKIAELERMIGQRQIELEWLKKKFESLDD